MKTVVTGDGRMLEVYICHGCARRPRATFHDQATEVRASLQGEVELCRKGFLDAEGQTAAEWTTKNLANWTAVSITLRFFGIGLLEMVEVIGGSTGKRFRPRHTLQDESDKKFARMFALLDAKNRRIANGPALAVS